MAAKFISDMPLAGLEAQMQQVPGFKPRRSGMSVSRLEVPSAQGGCGRGTGGQGGDCGSPGGGCKHFSCLLGYFTKEVGSAPLADRVAHLELCARRPLWNKDHGERFWQQWQAQGLPKIGMPCVPVRSFSQDSNSLNGGIRDEQKRKSGTAAEGIYPPADWG